MAMTKYTVKIEREYFVVPNTAGTFDVTDADGNMIGNCDHDNGYAVQVVIEQHTKDVCWGNDMPLDELDMTALQPTDDELIEVADNWLTAQYTPRDRGIYDGKHAGYAMGQGGDYGKGERQRYYAMYREDPLCLDRQTLCELLPAGSGGETQEQY